MIQWLVQFIENAQDVLRDNETVCRHIHRILRILPGKDRTQQLLKDLIGDLAPLNHSLLGVKTPMNPEIDSADCILFRRIAQAVEVACDRGAHVSFGVCRHAVEFVRVDVEGDFVGPIKVCESAEDGRPKRRMTRCVCRKGRREVRGRLMAVTSWCSQRHPIGLHSCIGISVRVPRPNCHDGAPEIVEVFRLPGGDSRVGHREVHQGKQTRVLDERVPLLNSNGPRDLVVETRGRSEFGSAVVGPEGSNLCLFRSAVWNSVSISIANFGVEGPRDLHLLERCGIFGTVERGGWLHAELRSAGHGERSYASPAR